jgi:hypothetical protein
MADNILYGYARKRHISRLNFSVDKFEDWIIIREEQVYHPQQAYEILKEHYASERYKQRIIKSLTQSCHEISESGIMVLHEFDYKDILNFAWTVEKLLIMIR